jgi:hypothetical protein
MSCWKFERITHRILLQSDNSPDKINEVCLVGLTFGTTVPVRTGAYAFLDAYLCVAYLRAAGCLHKVPGDL